MAYEKTCKTGLFEPRASSIYKSVDALARHHNLVCRYRFSACELFGSSFEISPQELAEKWNVRGVMAKPFSPRELVQKVQELLREQTEPATAQAEQDSKFGCQVSECLRTTSPQGTALSNPEPWTLNPEP